MDVGKCGKIGLGGNALALERCEVLAHFQLNFTQLFPGLFHILDLIPMLAVLSNVVLEKRQPFNKFVHLLRLFPIVLLYHV